MGVKVHTGELESAVGVSDARLPNVVNRWRMHAAIVLPDALRDLARLVDETERLRVWERLGYDSPEAFYRKELLLDEETIRMACTWVVTHGGAK